MNAQERIGKRLKKVRKELGLKQVEVAEKAGVSSNYYSFNSPHKFTAITLR